MTVLKIILSVLGGYLSGSVMFAVILTRNIYGTDVRTQGSHNAGATNVARVFGLGSGLLTFVGDTLKTVAAFFIGKLIFGEIGAVIAMASCLVGHCFPVFFGFKGGKGVSVGAAVALIIDWRIFLLLIAVFAVVFIISHRVSVCSLTAALVFPVAQLIIDIYSREYVILGFFTAVLIWVMHRDNIGRILRGEEARFVQGKRER